MARQSIRSYNAFLREARAQHGLSLKEARAAYRGVTERLGRPAKGVDVARHPRITKQEAQKAEKAVAKQERAERRAERAREKGAAEKPGRAERPAKREKGGAEPAAPPPAPKAKPFTSLAQYLDWFEEADFYDYEEADGTVDY